jgi:hypothetical protein
VTAIAAPKPVVRPRFQVTRPAVRSWPVEVVVGSVVEVMVEVVVVPVATGVKVVVLMSLSW